MRRLADRFERLRQVGAWNRARQRYGLDPLGPEPTPFLDLPPKPAEKGVLHLLASRSPEADLERIVAIHTALPEVGFDIVLATRTPALGLPDGAAKRLTNDRADTIFRLLAKERPRLMHVHIDRDDGNFALVPEVAALLRIPCVVTFSEAAPAAPVPFARATSVERWSGDDVAEGVEALWPLGLDREVAAGGGRGDSVLTWLRGNGSDGAVLDVLAHAMSQRAGLRAAIVGGGEPQALRKLLRDRKLTDRADVLGPCRASDVEKLVSTAGAVLAPEGERTLFSMAIRASAPLVVHGGNAALVQARRKIYERDPAAQVSWMLEQPSEAVLATAALGKPARKTISRAATLSFYRDIYLESLV
jgi:hypothetical protein